MPKPPQKVLIDDVVFYSVPDAARMLRTTTPIIRKMMGDGSLKWAQKRSSGRLLIAAESIANVKYGRMASR